VQSARLGRDPEGGTPETLVKVHRTSSDYLMKSVLYVGVLFLLTATSAVAQGMSKVMVNGVPVRVYGTVEQGHVVVAGKQAVIQNEHDAFVAISGIYEGNGRTYVMVAENCGGSACGDVFQAVDMTTPKYVVSPVFGTGVSGAKPEVRNGALLLTQKTADGTSTFHYSFKDGKLETVKEALDLEATGPDKAPGGDIAALASGKTMGAVFKLRATAMPLRAIMGEDAFGDARSVALDEFGQPFAEKQGMVSANACQPHNCSSHSLSVAFDHEGHVWALLISNDVGTYYGNPDQMVQWQLKQAGAVRLLRLRE
jgi:hypothetical protein